MNHMMNYLSLVADIAGGAPGRHCIALPRIKEVEVIGKTDHRRKRKEKSDWGDNM